MKYVCLRKGVLYFYKKSSAESAQSSYMLKDLMEGRSFTEKNPGESSVFLLVNYSSFIKRHHKQEFKMDQKAGRKNILFKAQNPQMKDLWLKYITETCKLQESSPMIDLSSSYIHFFKDV